MRIKYCVLIVLLNTLLHTHGLCQEPPRDSWTATQPARDWWQRGFLAEDLDIMFASLKEDSEERVDVLRHGLRQAGFAAAWSARRLDPKHLDAFELRRAVRVLSSELRDKGQRESTVESLSVFLSSEELGESLGAIVESGDLGGHWGAHWRDLVRPRSYVALAQALASRGGIDAGGREEIFCFVQGGLLTTDRYREEIAALVLQCPRAGAAEPGRGEPVGVRLARGVLLGEWPGFDVPGVRVWLSRWLASGDPALRDRGLLEALAARSGDLTELLALRASGEQRQQPLDGRRGRRTFDPILRCFLIAARARQGDEAALRELMEWGRHDALALAMLADGHPVELGRLVEDALRAGELGSLLGVFELASGASDAYGLTMCAVPTANVESLLKASPGIRDLCKAYLHLPGAQIRAIPLRLPDLLQRLAAAEDPAVEEIEFLSSADFLEVLGVAEVVRPEALRRAGRSLFAAGDAERRAAGAKILLAMGDANSGLALLEWIETEPGEALQRDLKGDLSLVRSWSPPLEARFRERATEGNRWAVALLATIIGVPELVSQQTHWRGGHGEPDWLATFRRSVLAGDKDAAASSLVTGAGNVVWEGMGMIQFQPVREHLTRLRRLRSLLSYAAATAELAAAGDAPAREEIWSELRAGRHAWIHHLDGFQLTLGFDPCTAAHWIEELESSQDRIVDLAERIYIPLFRLSWILDGPWIAKTPYARALRRWDFSRGKAAWSHILRGFVLVPE